MLNSSDLSGQDFAGPSLGGEEGGRDLKLPVMYFDSNDEIFFEDENLQN